MKIYRYLMILGTLMAFAIVASSAVKYAQPLVTESALSYDKAFTVDSHGNFDDVSFQAVYATATISSVSFNDGRVSTGSLTVASYAALSTAPASVSITISSNNPAAANNSLDGSVLTLNGVRYVAGPAGKWLWSTTPTLSAVNLAAAITADGVFAATSAGAVVYATTTLTGSSLNAWTVVTSSAGVLSIRGDTTATTLASTLTGGQDNAAIAINGTRIVANRDFFPKTSNAVTATALAAGINATIPSIVAAQATGAVVIATSTSVGAATTYSLYSSTQAALTVDGTVTADSASGATGAMRGGSNSAYAYNSGTINIPAHGLSTAYPVWLSTTAGFGITGLTGNVTYYSIISDANNIKLAATSTGAVAGSYITLLSTSVVGPHTFGLNAQTYSTTASTPTFIWSASNDGSNFTQIPGVSSVTWSTPAAGSQLWEFAPATYRYYRFSITKPGTGGMNISVTTNGNSY
jgi:hypothetical protein